MRWVARSVERLLVLERIAEGVHRLHAMEPHAIVHGDIKSDNVLLTAGGEPRLSDFGLAALKKATTSSGSASTAASSPVSGRGTWPYMAPELYKWGDKLAVSASRTTDVYALGTLAWEVLVGEIPWKDDTEASRLAALLAPPQKNLKWERLPADLPADLREVLARSVDEKREARPTARQLWDAFIAARELLHAASFDIFLSHAWVGDGHAPLTVLVHSVLRDTARAHVWLDKHEMGHDMGASMRSGIARSEIVVALVSRYYASRPNCMLELREASRARKPIVAVIVDDGGWWPSRTSGSEAERELAHLIGAKEVSTQGGGHLFVDLSKATTASDIPWHSLELASAHATLQHPSALPTLLRLVRELLPAKGVSGGASSGGGGGGGVVIQAGGAGVAAVSKAFQPEPDSPRGDKPTRAPPAKVSPAPHAPPPVSFAPTESVSDVVKRMVARAGEPAVIEAGAKALVERTGGSGLASARIETLRVLGINYDARCRECVASGALRTLSDALHHHLPSPTICDAASCAIRNITLIPACAEAAIGIVRELVGVLHRHAALADTCTIACAALWNIADIALGQEAAVASGAIRELICVLRNHAGSASACEFASRALANIGSTNTSHRSAIISKGAIPLLTAALKRHGGARCGGAQVALDKLSLAVARSAPSVRGKGTRFGPALPSVRFVALGAPRAASHGPAVLKHTASASSMISSLADASISATRVVEMMLSMSGNVGVIEAGLAALVAQTGGNLSSLRDVEMTAKASASCLDCVASGGVQMLLGAMQKHIALARICEEACSALRNISIGAGDVGSEVAVSSGAMPQLTTIMQTHFSIPGVCEQASGALSAIAASSAGLAAVSADTAPVLVGALKTHATLPNVCVNASGALLNMSFRDEFATSAIAAGALPQLILVLRDHANDERVCEAASGAITTLTSDAAMGLAALDGGALPLLSSVLRVHAGSAKACLRAGGAVHNIMQCGEVAKVCALASNAIPPLLAALRAHAENLDLCTTICAALQDFTTLDAGKKEIVAAEGIPIFVSVLRLHAADSSIYKTACGALQNLISSETEAFAVAATGIIAHFERALSAHASVADVCGPICDVIANIALFDSVDAAIPDIAAVLRSFSPSIGGAGSRVCESACRALAHIASSSEASRLEICAQDGDGLVPLLRKLLRKHGSDKCPSAYTAIDALDPFAARLGS